MHKALLIALLVLLGAVNCVAGPADAPPDPLPALPEPGQVVGISRFSVADIQELSTPGNPPTGYLRLYADSGTEQLKCLTSAGASCLSGGGGSTAFSALTSSTNTTAAMVVGTGASLATSGSGTIAATSCKGADTQILFNDGGVCNGDSGLTWGKATGSFSAVGSDSAGLVIAAGLSNFIIVAGSAASPNGDKVTVQAFATATSSVEVNAKGALSLVSVNDFVAIGTTLGTPTSGVLKFIGKSSGNAQLGVADAAGTPNRINLPTATGGSGTCLKSDGANPQQTSWVACLTATAPTNHGVLLGSGTQAVNATAAPATANQPFVSGASADPSFLPYTIPATIAAHQTLVATGTTTVVAKTLPDCTDTGGNHLNYTQSTDAYSCGTSGGGSGTVTTFSAGDLSPLFTSNVANPTTAPALTFALTNAAGGTVFGNSSGSSGAPSYTATPVLGRTGTSGSLGFTGLTSGTVSIKVQDAAGTYNYNLPTTAGNSGDALTSGGGVAAPMTWTALVVGPQNTPAVNNQALCSYVSATGAYTQCAFTSPATDNATSSGDSTHRWSNIFGTALTCGITGTTSCVITGSGSTSGTATITWPAVSGTTSNAITFSNAITAGGQISTTSGSVLSAAASAVGPTGRSLLRSAADGRISFNNNANGSLGLTRVVFGTEAATNPAFAPLSTILDVVDGAGTATLGNTTMVSANGNKVFVTTNFTTAANTNLQTITGLTFNFPAVAHNWNYTCHLAYSQGTANVAVAFGIQAATNNPTNIFGTGTMQLSTVAGVSTYASGTLATLATTTATAIVSGTPGATATNYYVDLGGTLELGASANAVNIMVSTATSGDAVTVLRGSSCQLF